MSFHPTLRPLIARLRPRSARMAVATGVLVMAAVIGVAGIALHAVSRPDQPQGSGSSGSAEPYALIPVPPTQAPVAPARVGPVDQLTDGANPDEISRQLEDLPAGRWSYAFHSTAERPSVPAPATPLPRQVMPVLPASALGFAWPLRGVVTSGFDDHHPLGIDIAPAEALGLVLAARDGTVVAAGGDPCCGYGYFVMLDHGDGVTSIYGHLQETPPFHPGDRLERGTVLGVAGDTGHSYGVHLHFEVRMNGVPVNPEAALTDGQLVPLPVREPAATPIAPDPHEGDPHRGTPALDGDMPEESTQPEPETEESTPTASHSDESMEEQESDSTSPPTPEPSAVPTPDAATPAPTASSTMTPSPTSMPSTPTPTATAMPTATATPHPNAAAHTTPTQIASATPPALTATPATASPSPAATLTPTPTSTASPSPSNPPTPTPRCDTVRFPATDGFIVLTSDGVGVRSLMAERCGDDGATTVVVRPTADFRCIAELVRKDTTRGLRPLPAADESDGTSTPEETRWKVEASSLQPDTAVRVACHPATLPDFTGEQGS